MVLVISSCLLVSRIVSLPLSRFLAQLQLLTREVPLP